MPQNRQFPVEVRVTRDFERSLKQYRKTYRSVASDVGEIVKLLKQHETPGDRLQGVSAYTVYKVRVRNSDNNKGQSGGYRICYLVLDANTKQKVNIVVLLFLYSKSDQADVESSELLDIIASYLADNTEALDEPNDT